jgi:hypothetical protein
MGDGGKTPLRLRFDPKIRLGFRDDTNDAGRLFQDPAMRVVVGWQGSEQTGASTSEMGRFETELLTQKDNLRGLETCHHPHCP